MSLIVLASASGSPGVTTTALGLVLGWPRPAVLVEADPTGGSPIAAGYFRGSVNPPAPLIDLAVIQQVDGIVEALPQSCFDLPGTESKWVPGTRSHEQARTLVSLWEPLAAALKSLDATGQDVIVDAGRLGLFGSPEPVLYAADLALLVVRNDLVSLAGARSWAVTLRDRFGRSGGASALGVLLVGEHRPFSGQNTAFAAREISSVLQLPVVTSVPWDPASAAVLSAGADPPQPGLLQRLSGRDGWEESALLRGLRGARSAIAGRIRINEEQLHAAGRTP